MILSDNDVAEICELIVNLRRNTGAADLRVALGPTKQTLVLVALAQLLANDFEVTS